VEEAAARAGRQLYESAGINAADVTFENAYDGFTLNGPHPVSPSGGNCGNGRTRFWGDTDAIQQIQERAGVRSIRAPIMFGVSGGPNPTFSNYVVWCAEPST
jgi:hypothetical protein